MCDALRQGRWKIGLVLVVALLTSGLASLEFAEFGRLADDSSNDFAILKVPHGPQVPAAAHAGPHGDTARFRALTQAVEEPRIAATPPFAHAGADILAFGCVLRT
jgi:hypothetical protein